MLPDFGWTELLVISIVLIVVIGPKDLPRILRGFGSTMSSVRRMAGDFRKQFDDALKEAELDDVRKLADDVRSLDPRRQIKDALNPLSEPLEEIGRDIDADMKRAMGDTKPPELPKSPPQMGLDQAGAKARAAQAAKGKSSRTRKPAAEPVAGAQDATAATKAGSKSGAATGARTAAKSGSKFGAANKTATAAKAPPTARARSKTAKGGASEKPARDGKPSSKAAANGTTSKPAARKPGTRTATAKAAATKSASAKPRKRQSVKTAGDDTSGGSTSS